MHFAKPNRALIAAGFVFVSIFGLAPAAKAQPKKDPNSWCQHGKLPVPLRPDAVAAPQIAGPAHSLAVIYAVPSNVPFNQSAYERIIEATLDIQAWYQCASGGITWQLAYPEIVRVYQAAQTREYYRTNGNWWGSLLGEMAANGQPIWSPGTVAAVWAHGAGWWAGGAQSCGAECGVALLGVEIFPEFNNPAWSGGVCPGGVGGAAWPCTAAGAYAHELGHTIGLPHPFDFPETHDVAYHSIMQTHWSYPNFAPPSESPWGFLTVERQKMRVNPFMRRGIGLFQMHPGCDVVNLPSIGTAPTANFQLVTDAQSIRATNTSQGADLDYWMFGDGGVSNVAEPTHTYLGEGTHHVSLRVSSSNSVMDQKSQDVGVAACRDAIARASVELGSGFWDDAFTLDATLESEPAGSGINPSSEDVSLKFGPFLGSIPRNSFQFVKGKEWQFSGRIGGANLVDVTIRPRGKNTYALSVDARGVELGSLAGPVNFGIAIGKDAWCSAISAKRIR